jgi:hypothetical protein
MESQIPEGMRIHYNYVKKHQVLEGMIPAERSGILGLNNWEMLLEQAIKNA